MALNWTMLTPNRTPVPLPNETTITMVDLGAEVDLLIPDQPPSNHALAGGFGGAKKLKSIGKIWLTDQRFIFAGDSRNPLDSLSVPLHSIVSTRFEQPTFSGNYLVFEIKPSPDGGLTDGTRAEVRFKDRPMFEFVSLLEKAREKSIYMRRQAADEADESLPTYTTPIGSSSVTFVDSVPVENPPSYDN